MQEELRVYIPFEKVDRQADGTLMVHTRLNDETTDDQGEVVTFEAIEKAAGDYLQWANVREMHDDHTASGTMVSFTPIPEERAHDAVLHVVDPVAVQKVLTKVYKGTSLGGFKRRVRMGKAAGSPRQVTEIDWRETSLVDRPSRPSAVLTLMKRSDLPDPEEETIVDVEPTDAPVGDLPVAEGMSKASEGTEPTVVLEPSQGDVYLKDGVPIVGPAPEAPAPALAKSAADDVDSLTWALTCITRAAEREAAEGDQAGADALKKIASDLTAAIAVEVQEVGTPEAQAEAADEADATVVVAVTAMEYASKIADLRKAAEALLVATATTTEPAPEPAAPAAAVAPTILEPLAKAAEASPTADEIVSAVLAKVGGIASESALKAMAEEVLGAVKSVQEELAKVARQPAEGGPLMYAPDARRYAEMLDGRGTPKGDAAMEAEVLNKVAAGERDPLVKEALGLAAARLQIAAAGI